MAAGSKFAHASRRILGRGRFGISAWGIDESQEVASKRRGSRPREASLLERSLADSRRGERAIHASPNDRGVFGPALWTSYESFNLHIHSTLGITVHQYCNIHYSNSMWCLSTSTPLPLQEWTMHLIFLGTKRLEFVNKMVKGNFLFYSECRSLIPSLFYPIVLCLTDKCTVHHRLLSHQPLDRESRVQSHREKSSVKTCFYIVFGP